MVRFNHETKTKNINNNGGTTFKNRKDYLGFLKNLKINLEKRIRWQNEYLDKKIGKDFEIVRPTMPLKENAKYGDWKIYFEHYLKLLGKDFILIGNSLGGIFLAKYLSENKLKHKAKSVFLICPPFDGSLSNEDLAGGFKLEKDLSLIEKNAKEVHLMFSKDDDVVPIEHANKYKKKLQNSEFHIYESKNGHFKVLEFPEIVKLIRKCKK